MKAFELVESVCRGRVPVYEQADGENSPGQIGYHPGFRPLIQGIFLKEPTHQDGYSLAVAAHEAFHAKRAMEGVPFYQLLPAMLTGRQVVEEELLVNAQARDWLLPRLTTEADRREAERCFYESEISYVDAFYTLAATSLRDLDRARSGRHAVEPLKQLILRELLGIGQPPVSNPLQDLFDLLTGDLPAATFGDTDGDTVGPF